MLVQNKKILLHVDYDAYLYERLTQQQVASDLIFEKHFTYKKFTDQFTLCRPQLFDECKNLPEWWHDHKNSDSYDFFFFGSNWW
jgi:hypothetical protein